MKTRLPMRISTIECSTHFEDSYREKAETLGDELLIRLEKEITLMILDRHWKDHLAAMDYLRQGIGLRGYAQKESGTGIQARIL